MRYLTLAILLSACAANVEPSESVESAISEADAGCVEPLPLVVLEFDRADSCTLRVDALERSVDVPPLELWGWHQLGKNCPPVAYRLTPEPSPQDDGYTQDGATIALNTKTCRMAMTGKPYFKFEVRLAQ